MSGEVTVGALSTLADAALRPRAIDPATERGDPPARFLVIAGNRSAAEIEAGLRLVLPAEPFTLEARPGEALVLTLTARTFGLAEAVTAPGPAYSLGSALASATGAALVDPDLPRASAPAQRRGIEGLESIDDFPPGCWVKEEDNLSDYRWALKAINIPDAWARSAALGRPAKGEGIVIAQPDTGVHTHPELVGVVQAGAFNTLGDGPPNDATDPLQGGFGLNPGHGTATASVVVSPDHAATKEVVGSAPAARHLPIRAVRSVWLHEEIPIADAIDKAVAAGAHVITMSLGGATLPFSPLRAAIRRAVARHVIVMAAAGNCVTVVVYPARFSECIAVAGTDAAGRRWPGSCSGPAVDISAPGQNVYRASVEPRPAGSVGQGQGTSFAVALTAGVAACWLAHHGRDRLIAEAQARGETLQVMFRRLVRASATRPPGWDGVNMGGGIVDALALIEAPFDLGRGTEAPVAEEPRRPADEMRAFVAELVSADPQMGDDFLIAHGAELSAALLAHRLDPAAPVQLSPGLAAGLTPPVRAALGITVVSPLPTPAILPTPPEPRPDLSVRIALVRHSLAMGRAIAGGTKLESAVDVSPDALPTPADLHTRLDDLLTRMPPSEVKDKAAFERAVSLLREQGGRGLDKLPDASRLLAPGEIAALEAVVKTDGSRPSLIVRKNTINEAHPLIGGWADRLTEARERISAIAALCGRIQPPGGHASRFSGTGFLVDPAGPWVLSNYHVLAQALRSYPVVTTRTARGLAITSGLEVDFVGEADSDASNRWSIVEAVFPENAGEGFGFVDAVLFRLGGPLDGGALPRGGPSAPLDHVALSTDGAYVNGQKPILATLGFPGRPAVETGIVDGVDWGWVVGTLFGATFGVKRLAPGEFYRTAGSHPLDRGTRYAFSHDATTLRGASGSVVFTLTDAAAPAFGLHFAGYDNESNYAIKAGALKDSFPAGLAFP